jgi:general secretion pathway protein C
MDLGVDRRTWVTELVGVAIAAGLAAHATATLLGARLLPHVESLPRGRPTYAAAPPADKPVDAIVGRNVFCSSCEATPPVERSLRPVTLLAIMFAPAPSDAGWSVAILRDDDAATTGPYGVGDGLCGATIVAIEDVRVVLDVGGGRREVLELLHPSRAPADPRGANRARWSDGVAKVGPHSYEVQRAALEQFLAGGGARPLPRVAPQTRGGEPVGLRLSGIGRDGPFAAIGIVDGDVLLEVNGRSIATPDAALAAYAALRSASHVSLLIDRLGERVRMEYVVR